MNLGGGALNKGGRGKEGDQEESQLEIIEGIQEFRLCGYRDGHMREGVANDTQVGVI